MQVLAPGGREEPITISPVRIVRGPPTGSGPLGPAYRLIEDFGAVVAEDTTISASVSFCDDDGGSDDGEGNGAPVVSGGTNNDEVDRTTAGGPVRLSASGGWLPVAEAVGAVLLTGACWSAG